MEAAVFKFTIRDLLWLTVVTAVGALLVVQHRYFAAQIEGVKMEMQQHVRYAHIIPPPGMRRAIVEWPPGMKGNVKVRYEPIP
jgi:hypothetical protein